MTEDDVLQLFVTCSNEGRWGADDERGTLNLVTPATRLDALRLVQAGVVVSIGRDLATRGSAQVPPSAVQALLYDAHVPAAALESLTLVPHGFEMTHLDAVAHSFFEGRVYNGRRADEVVHRVGGISFGSVMAHADGIITRGVLLDIAAVRGADFLEAGAGITVADLEAAEERAGVRVGRGDAIFVRSGQMRREAQSGPVSEFPREGLLAECIPWLHAREIAVYSGDCIERLPSGYARVTMPLHQVGMVAMGLAIMDCADCERLAAACATYDRAAFCLIVAPLRVPGGTASAVNPLALF